MVRSVPGVVAGGIPALIVCSLWCGAAAGNGVRQRNRLQARLVPVLKSDRWFNNEEWCMRKLIIAAACDRWHRGGVSAQAMPMLQTGADGQRHHAGVGWLRARWASHPYGRCVPNFYGRPVFRACPPGFHLNPYGRCRPELLTRRPGTPHADRGTACLARHEAELWPTDRRSAPCWTARRRHSPPSGTPSPPWPARLTAAAARLRDRGRLVYAGAGASARLGRAGRGGAVSDLRLAARAPRHARRRRHACPHPLRRGRRG